MCDEAAVLAVGGSRPRRERERAVVRIVVIGGTGRIGSKVVSGLIEHGHDALATAPSTGVDAFTGAGLAEVLTGAQVVVDVTNSPSFDEEAAREFFDVATANLLAAEARATYWGVDIDEDTLVPRDGAMLSDIRFEDWMLETAARS